MPGMSEQQKYTRMFQVLHSQLYCHWSEICIATGRTSFFEQL